MCEALEKVTETEWEETKHRVEETEKTVEKINLRMAQWGGGLAVILGIIGVIGGFLLNGVSKTSDNIRDNTIALVAEREKQDMIKLALVDIKSDLKEAKTLIETKTTDRFTSTQAEARFSAEREQSRQMMEQQKNMADIQRLELERDIEEIKRDTEKLKRESHEHNQ